MPFLAKTLLIVSIWTCFLLHQSTTMTDMFSKKVNRQGKALNQTNLMITILMKTGEVKMFNMMVGHIVFHMRNTVHIHVPSATVCLTLQRNLLHICHLTTRMRRKKKEMRGIVQGLKKISQTKLQYTWWI